MLSRPRLEAELDGALGRRLTAITAGAGSGKTTILTQWIARKTVAWHTVAPEDISLSVLVRNVLSRLRLQVPDLSRDLLMAVSGAQGPDGGGPDPIRADALAAELCRDLETKLARDLVLVLDDVHALGSSSESGKFLAALCRHAPGRLHIVTASRESLPFPIGRMRLEGQAATLGADSLAFTTDEVEQMLRLVLGDEAASNVDDLMAQTGGWTAAVVFAVQLIAIHGVAVEPQEVPGQPLFDYLAEEVIGSETEESIQTLRKVAELPWITKDLVNALELESEGESLFGPGKRTIFVSPTGDGKVSVAPLVRSFILTRHRLEDQARHRVLEIAASWYENEGAYMEALSCLGRLPGDDLTARFLVRRGDTMIAEGSARQVIEAIERLLERPKTPDIRLLEAEARQILGDWEGATACYEAMTPSDGPIPARLAWRLGLLHHMRGNVGKALEIYRRGPISGDDPSNEAALLGWQASAFWLRGDRDESERLANHALALAREANDHRTLATAHTVLAMVAALDGDRAANDTHYLRALEHAEQARDVVQTIRIRSNRGSHFLEQGEFEPALAELEVALKLADITGFALWRAMSLSNRAQVFYFRGRLEEAIADLEQARLVFRALGSNLESYPLAHLGDVYALRGDLALARTAYEQAVALSEEPADLQALVPALSGLARILLDEDPVVAGELADRAANVASVLGHVKALIAGGFVAMASGRLADAHNMSKKAAEVARSRMDLPGLAEALELEAAASQDDQRVAGLLDQADSIWAEIGVPIGRARVELARAALKGGNEGRDLAAKAASTLERLGAKGLAQTARRLASSLQADEENGVAIRTLGGLSFMRAGVPIPNTDWQSRVAREVLAMLVAARGRPLHREVLLERLWPDDDLAKAGNRLSVALTTIRNVLDPQRSHEADHYLVTSRDTVALDLDHVSVDVEEFFADARKGRSLLRSAAAEEGLELLRRAEARYVGVFLVEHIYADWATALREEARSEFRSVVETLAATDSAAGDHDAAARRYLRILEEDAYNEPAHLALVSAMVASRRHGTARRLYGIYVSRMAELGVEPAGFPGPE